MDPERKRLSSTRKMWLLIGGIVVFVVVFDLLEKFISSEPTPPRDGSTPEKGANIVQPPALPELRRLDDGAIEIRHDFFRRSTIRLGNKDEQDALFDCLAHGIEQTFGEGTEGWRRARVRRETQRIQDECMGSSLDMPVLPRPPRPQGSEN